MGFSFSVASRFLKSSKSQTLFIILGIAIGVSVQVFVGTLISSLQQSLIDRTIGSAPHITISTNNTSGQIEDWEPIIEEVDKVQGIKHVSIAVEKQLFIVNFSKTVVSLMRGLDLDQADLIYNYKKTIYEGAVPDAVNETLIGKELQIEYNLKVGDTLEMVTGEEPFDQSFNVTIAGFYDLGVASLNRLWMITSNQTVREMFNTGTNVTSIEIQVEDVFAADVIAAELDAAIVDDEIRITNWKAENESLLSGLDGQTISSVMIQVFVLVSVVIGISSVLAITVMQKSKQIGILKAMGITDQKASMIFLSQGFLLGLGGALIGVLLGVGLMEAFVTFAVDSKGNPIIDLYYDYGFIGLSAVIALVASMAASLIPARKSSKLDVIEVIRNG